LFIENQLNSYTEILVLVIDREFSVLLVLDKILEQYLVNRLDNLFYYIAIRVLPIFEIIDNYNIDCKIIALKNTILDRKSCISDQLSNSINFCVY